ncbi:hypothetical protein LCGC14_2068180 [marine sediment metagenome]|uniref:Uncharacterized protein n=1 Tax=marine sediment metagenome TaxID=412755 RepID=A0A0F9EJ38_9ZZZZ
MTVLASGLLGHLLGMAFVPRLVGVAVDSEEAALSAANSRSALEWLGRGAFGIEATAPAVATSPNLQSDWL